MSGKAVGFTIPLLVLSVSMMAAGPLTIPPVSLIDQHGKPVNVATELTGGGVAIVNFIFTSCQTICTPMGANFGRLQKMLDDRGENRIRLVSITVDSQTDTPARLEKWSSQFHANARWTLLTGPNAEVTRVLKAFGVYTPDKFAHSSVTVILNAKGESTRSDGLRPPEELMRLAVNLLPASQTLPARANVEPSAAQSYFTDTRLVDQNGAEHRFYSDLVKGKVVIINVMFTTCKDSCPMLTANFARMQKWLGPRLNSEVRMLSISVDPETDTPQKLKEYANMFKAQPGWYFLTGSKDNVGTVLRKLGLYVEAKGDHSNVFLIGNDRTGLWKKAFGMAAGDELIKTLDSVLQDRG